MQLDVIAEDRKGRIITGLSREQFEVYDEGRMQRIQVFRNNSIRDSLPVASSATALSPSTQTMSGSPSVSIILIDSLNTKWTNQAYAKQQLVQFLLQINPDDHIGIYSMGPSGVHALYEYSRDPVILLAKLKSLASKKEQRPAKNPPSAVDIGAELDSWLKGDNSDYVSSQLAERTATEQSLRVLTALSNQLASIPGRKNVFWISDGFPLVSWTSLLNVVFDNVPADGAQAMAERAKAEPRSFTSEAAIAMRAISDDNVAIYPIYAGCLYSPFYSASSENPQAAGMKELVGGIHAREEAMDEIAKKTGGRAFYERNDLKNALREALDESKASYTLGFYPDADQFNGKFRALKVKVAGRSGIRLRYRQGYLDSPQVLSKPQEIKPN